MRILFASGVALAAMMAAPVAAQYYPGGFGSVSYDSRELREAQRDYRRGLYEARQKCAEELRDADDRADFREERRKCREEIAEVERDYRDALREARRDRRDDRRDFRYDDDDDD